MRMRPKRQRGVSYCDEKQCIRAHRFKNRDVDAAYKIGVRFIAQQESQPWNQNVKQDDIAGYVPFSGFRDVLFHLLHGVQV